MSDLTFGTIDRFQILSFCFFLIFIFNYLIRARYTREKSKMNEIRPIYESYR